jgi:gas vesicle protein
MKWSTLCWQSGNLFPVLFILKSNIMKPAMRVLSALGIGLAAGAVAGILMAPGKGADTRKLIKREGEKMADRIKFNIRQGEKKLTRAAEDLGDTQNGLKQRALDIT